jgi:hypothetical protein
MASKSAKTTTQAPAPTRKRRATPVKKARLELVREFVAKPDDALVTTAHVAAYTDTSEATHERDRWSGTGIPFIKIARTVRYRKRDVLAYLEARTRTSTTEAGATGTQ